MMTAINTPQFKFVVVGGGTAGWLAALYMRAYFPSSTITVIENRDLGILGAGEGTTPHFFAALKFLNINISEFVRETQATVKNGILFRDWHGDGTHYFHPFAVVPDHAYMEFFHADKTLTNRDVNALVAEQLAHGQTLDAICFSAQCSAQHRVVYAPGAVKQDAPLTHFRSLGSVGWHFNANLVAAYFKRLATTQRQITCLDALVTGVATNDRGDLTALHLDQSPSLPCDFVFDCTGFRRVLIGQHFQSPWTSYAAQLPVTRALPFFLPETAEIPPYTESRAMRYGWLWKIPVQGRYGCGYVFDGRRLTDDAALREVETRLNRPIESPRTFAFEPGSFDRSWQRNCLALGLSSGFLEPLEATSLMVTVLSLQHFFQHLTGVLFDDEPARTAYHTTVASMNRQIRDFLYFHYRTTRTDTPFWAHFAEDQVCPEDYRDRLAQIRHVQGIGVVTKYLPTTIFSAASYLAVGAGVRWFDRDAASRRFAALTHGVYARSYAQSRQHYRRQLALTIPTTITHRDFLNYLMDSNHPMPQL